MTTITGAEREAQRVAHVVLQQPRPKRQAAPVRPAGMAKAEWKALRTRILAEPVRLAQGIEQAVALREALGGSKATPETRRHVTLIAGSDGDLARLARQGVIAKDDIPAILIAREGSLARLVRSGTLDLHQLAAAEEIRAAHDAITAEVRVRTARLERGLSGGARSHGDGESFAQIARQISYTRWRETVAPHAAMLLAIVVDDMALTTAARRWRVSDRRARQLLGDALDRWRRG